MNVTPIKEAMDEPVSGAARGSGIEISPALRSGYVILCEISIPNSSLCTCHGFLR